LKPHSLNLVEAKFTQPNNFEHLPQLLPDFAFIHHGRPRLVGLASVAGEYQAHGSNMTESPQSLLVTLHIEATNDMVTAAVEEEIKRAEIR
jgi:hypothetical protein